MITKKKKKNGFDAHRTQKLFKNTAVILIAIMIPHIIWSS